MVNPFFFSRFIKKREHPRVPALLLFVAVLCSDAVMNSG